MDTVRLSLELPRELFSAIRQDPEGFMQEMRLAAAVKWYETEMLSQAKAAEIAGVSRAAFIVCRAQVAYYPAAQCLSYHLF
jgi:predicted HTH domain antitoxin